MNGQKNNKNTLFWVYSKLKKFIPAVLLLSLISAVLAVSYVVLALISKDVIDIATSDKNGSLLKSGISLFAVIIFQVVLSAASSVLKTHISGKMTNELRRSMFTSVAATKFSDISAFHSGDLLTRFTSDTDIIVTAAVGLIPSVVSMLAKIIAGVGTLLFLNSTFAVIILVLGTTIPFIGRIINKKFKYLHKESQRTEGLTRSFLQECFQNLVVLKSFVSEAPFLRKLNMLMDENYKIKVKRNYISVTANSALYSFFTIGYYAVLLWGAGLIAAGTITYGTLTAFLQLVSQLRAPLQNVSGIMPQYYSALASAERLIELESKEKEPKALNEKKIKALARSFEKIVVKDMSFSYKDEGTLKNCNFEIEKGRITAVTGRSGCGKSTFFKLLLGLYEPDSGSITINGNTQVNATTRALFAYVPQGNLILSGTIRENITLCNNSISEKEIIKAAKNAEIYDFISSLPEGFDTVISERGSGLSEGQLQRISIARALLTNAPILLLDESTSALDEHTETRLLSNIKELPDKTVLFITHRDTSVSVCDKVLKAERKKFTVIK